jgi:hypothetical protein
VIYLKDWEFFEKILKKPLEQIVDLLTMNWKKGLCKDKQKYFDKEVLLKALKEKNNEKNS